MWSYFKAEKEILDSLGPRPEPVKAVWGYAKGEVLGSFDNSSDALKANATTTETYIKNQEEVDNWRDARTAKLHALSVKWMDDLRQEYSHISDGVYDIIYRKAYDDSHSVGYDEVASKLDDLSDFAIEIIKAYAADI